MPCQSLVPLFLAEMLSEARLRKSGAGISSRNAMLPLPPARHATNQLAAQQTADHKNGGASMDTCLLMVRSGSESSRKRWIRAVERKEWSESCRIPLRTRNPQLLHEYLKSG